MKRRTQGMNWIRREKRLAIYLRDGVACVYCGTGVEEGGRLSLDHLVPYSRGGKNAATNLVTSCIRCNSSRGTRSVRAFCKGVAAYLNHEIEGVEIERAVRASARRKIDMGAARELLERRGTWTEALRRK